MLRLEKKHNMCWCVSYYEETLKQFNDSFHTHAKNNINALFNSQPQIPPKGSTRLLSTSKLYTGAKRTLNRS